MTVWVDDMEAEFAPAHRKDGARYIMCHMIANTDAELHRMADQIGVNRRWFQEDHYDIAKSKRALAVKLGAKQCTWRQAGAFMFMKRRGMDMKLVTPEKAEKVTAKIRAGK